MDLSIGDTNNVMIRDHRKGNWTLQETMVLIEAKKMDDERRMKRLGDGGERGKPAEPRWKWVEDYCWKNGCFRSQNQCNDKWDNLMRDFKRVREYERRSAEKSGGEDEENSYWGMDKNERKENNLPPNMLPQTYEALVEVVERKGPRAAAAAMSGCGAGGSNALMLLTAVEKSTSHVFRQAASTLPPSMEHPIIQLVPPIPPPVQRSAEPPTFPFIQPFPSVDPDRSEYSDSPAKRRKTRATGRGEGSGGDDGTLHEVGTAISKSATMIAEVIQACEGREEKRHKKVVSLHERRLQIEESKVETNRQCINGLVDAINKLANSILALAASYHKTQPNTSK
ncbi:uncharacterized protein [Primulina huaijiensis]|uniref:uncharacterized protein n=1 Tax=Primulina huaijiensis TaxID=1492673 RepID=UPI003CC7314E